MKKTSKSAKSKAGRVKSLTPRKSPKGGTPPIIPGKIATNHNQTSLADLA